MKLIINGRWLVLPVRAWPNETGEAVVARLVNEFERVGLSVVLEKAPDLAEEEYEDESEDVRHLHASRATAARFAFAFARNHEGDTLTASR